MFERRLKIILWLLGLSMLGLVARAGQIQIVERQHWISQATDLLIQRRFIEPTRGRILDRKGRELAVDEACMDACVEYPAIVDDLDDDQPWLHEQAIADATRRYGSLLTHASRQRRAQIMKESTDEVRQNVQAMWAMLAKVSGKTPAQIDEIRHTIIERVEMRRQYVWWQNYQNALAKQNNTASIHSFLKWWPLSGGDDEPNLDDYAVDVAEQSEAHVILSAIDTDEYNQLAKHAEDFPGLVLRTGRRRVYPFNEAACHVIGHLAAVSASQIKLDADADNPLRKYWPNDRAGQDGVESLCEHVLRGSRGEETRSSDAADWTTTDQPVPGQDVNLTIDVDLQNQIADAFKRRREISFTSESDIVTKIHQEQPGAAVVLDVRTGQALALVSYPTYDLNKLDEEYAQLSVDDINQPLVNRATQSAVEPGSTVKPLMALGALSDGVITPQSTIECNGYLVLDGHQYQIGRCWTMSEFHTTHHQVPESDPLPPGGLTVVDAIERSCNVFFETVADRMKMERQRYWYDRFGLGRICGIGLPETPGRIPNPAHIPQYMRREKTWFAGIGQGDIAATPLQMANAVATIARDGIWMRPSIIDGLPPDRVDLGFAPDALAAVKQGMVAVVNKRAGTGSLRHADPPDEVDRILVAGKTGTAQAPPLTIPVRDDAGQIVKENGREKRMPVDPSDPTVATWYISSSDDHTHFAHHWFIGFAPADHPQIAFAVFVEYGGSGGPVANSIARDVLAACVKCGYLKQGKEDSAVP